MSATKLQGGYRTGPERRDPSHVVPQPVCHDLLPWADPYVARLLVRHRLQAALNDSLAFLKDARER